MKGIYKIDQSRVSTMKGAELFAAMRVILISFLVVLVIVLLGKDQDVVSYSILIGIFLFITVLSVVVNLLRDGPWYYTEIEVTEQSVIRRGDGLLTVELRFDEISHLKKWKAGMLFFKKGIGSTINYYTSQYVLSKAAGILFVPIAIERYDDLVAHIKRKSSII
jgi:hypothetical protein